MANTDPDDVALLRQELSQFLLAEIASTEGGTAFRRAVSSEVGAVIDSILAERLKPALEKLEEQAAENARQLAVLMDELRRQPPPSDGDPAAQKLSDISGRLDDLRQRVGRVENAAKAQRLGVATAQPMQISERTEPRPGDERMAVAHVTGASLPRWMFWLLLVLLALTVLGLGNLYYEKLNRPDVVAAPPVVFTPPPAAASVLTPAPASAPAVSPPPLQQAASAPPQTPAPAPLVTPTPAPAVSAPPASAPQQVARIPADFAIERGWLAAQPFAVDPRLARRVGSNDSLPTLKSLVCGHSPNCTSDALMSEGMAGKQLIALQMLMSQIGDRFCAPRRSVAVTGLVSAAGLADLAAIAKCAGGAPARCTETQNRACPPDSDALQSGSQAARAALLRWALWKTGSN